MAALQSNSAIEALPPNLRQQLMDKLIAGEASRAVSQWLAEKGIKLSHAAINRYNQRTVKPALKMGAQLQRLQRDTPSTAVTPVDTAREVAEVTSAALAASPILARVEWMWSEVTEGVQESKGQWVVSGSGEKEYVPGDLKARAALINAGRGLLETEGKARNLPGFSAASQAPAGSTIQIAIITAPGESPRIQTNAAIDVDVVEIERA